MKTFIFTGIILSSIVTLAGCQSSTSTTTPPVTTSEIQMSGSSAPALDTNTTTDSGSVPGTVFSGGSQP